MSPCEIGGMKIIGHLPVRQQTRAQRIRRIVLKFAVVMAFIATSGAAIWVLTHQPAVSAGGGLVAPSDQ